MQRDMHFYAAYVMARAAGISPETAGVIAHADQYVDDALEDVPLELIENSRFFLPIMTSHIPLDYRNIIPGSDQWRIWVCFHFLPGIQGNSASERLVCRRGDDKNPMARAILNFALDRKNKSYGPHLAGIVSHVFQDTFSHYGFTGFSTDLNKVDQDSIETMVSNDSISAYIWIKAKRMWNRAMGSCAEVSKLGHGAVASLPDRPYLAWSYRYENDIQPPVLQRDNPRDYLEACRRLHAFFIQWAENNIHLARPGTPINFDTMEQKIRDIIAIEATKPMRCETWKQAIAQNQLFNSLPEDLTLEYESATWGFNQLTEISSNGTDTMKCDTFKFTAAARAYRNYVLGRLLPESEIVYY